jgi:hypothetical protein
MYVLNDVRGDASEATKPNFNELLHEELRFDLRLRQ